MTSVPKHKLMETIVFKKFAARPKASDGNIRKPIITTVVLAGLTSVAVLLAAAPAAAKASTAQSCSKKLQACSQRCEGRIPKGISQSKSAEMLVNCIKRTCNKQYDNCMKDSVGSGGSKSETPADPLKPKGGDVRTPPTGSAKDEPKAPPKVNDTRAPAGGGAAKPDGILGGGILDNGPGFGGQGPAATGSPGRPAAPASPAASGPLIR
jgi:hypothetical protein